MARIIDMGIGRSIAGDLTIRGMLTGAQSPQGYFAVGKDIEEKLLAIEKPAADYTLIIYGKRDWLRIENLKEGRIRPLTLAESLWAASFMIIEMQSIIRETRQTLRFLHRPHRLRNRFWKGSDAYRQIQATYLDDGSILIDTAAASAKKDGCLLAYAWVNRYYS